MKKYLFISGLVIISFSACKSGHPVGANGVEYKSALEYNNYIIDRQKKIVEGIKSYADALQISTDAGDKELDKVIGVVSTSLTDVQGMPAYNNDSAFRDAAIDLLAFYKKSFSRDFKEMLEIRKKIQDSTQTDNDMQRFNEIKDNVSKTEGPLDEKMKEAQGRFAKNNKLDLSDSSVQDEIDNLKKK